MNMRLIAVTDRIWIKFSMWCLPFEQSTNKFGLFFSQIYFLIIILIIDLTPEGNNVNQSVYECMM